MAGGERQMGEVGELLFKRDEDYRAEGNRPQEILNLELLFKYYDLRERGLDDPDGAPENPIDSARSISFSVPSPRVEASLKFDEPFMEALTDTQRDLLTRAFAMQTLALESALMNPAGNLEDVLRGIMVSSSEIILRTRQEGIDNGKYIDELHEANPLVP